MPSEGLARSKHIWLKISSKIKESRWMRFLSHQIKAAQGARDRNEIADAPNLIGPLSASRVFLYRAHAYPEPRWYCVRKRRYLTLFWKRRYQELKEIERVPPNESDLGFTTYAIPTQTTCTVYIIWVADKLSYRMNTMQKQFTSWPKRLYEWVLWIK